MTYEIQVRETFKSVAIAKALRQVPNRHVSANAVRLNVTTWLVTVVVAVK